MGAPSGVCRRSAGVGTVFDQADVVDVGEVGDSAEEADFVVSARRLDRADHAAGGRIRLMGLHAWDCSDRIENGCEPTRAGDDEDGGIVHGGLGQLV